MKYIHDYKDGSFCESTTFEAKVDGKDYIAVSDADYEDLCKGKKLIDNGSVVVNPDYVEPEEN